MNTVEARQLILDESIGLDGAVILFRMGNDPGPERMARIIDAMHLLFDDYRGAQVLDRGLANALFVLANFTESQVSSWERNGVTWRRNLTETELPALLFAVESIFADEWISPNDDTDLGRPFQ